MIKLSKQFIKSEKGNVESALVIIPLLFLFLGSLQLMAVISTRNLERTLAQEKARTYAMGIDHGFNGHSPPPRIQDLKTFWYSDKLQLFITKIEKEMPQIFPGINSLIHGKKISVVGSSVVEQQP